MKDPASDHRDEDYAFAFSAAAVITFIKAERIIEEAGLERRSKNCRGN